MLSDRCLSICLSVCLSVLPLLSVLSVTLVYCGQTIGWIKMKFGMHIDLDPGHTVFDGIQLPLPKGAEPRPNFWPISVVVKWLDGSRCHLVGRSVSALAKLLDGDPSPPLPKNGTEPLNFRPMSIAAEWSPISATAERFFPLGEAK